MKFLRTLPLALALTLAAPGSGWAQTGGAAMHRENPGTSTAYGTLVVDGIKVFYREAGPRDAPKIILLHGFPSSSHMFRNLIPALADRYHVIAPDYPGYGYSEMPSPQEFAYTFDNLADLVDKFLDQKGITRYSIYIQDYGAPIGFRLATRHPERIQAIITQNGNAYDDGLAKFWDDNIRPYWKDRNAETEAKVRALLTLETTKFQYSAGFRDPSKVSPDAWTHDQLGLDRPGNDAIQLALAFDYRNNPPLYPEWQKYLRTKRPPVLVVWARTTRSFRAPVARPSRGTCRTLRFTCLTPATLRSRKKAERLLA